MDGQAPTTPTPQAGDQPGQQQPDANVAQAAPVANAADTDKLIRQLRQENAERRVREKELADKLKIIEDAKLSEAEKQAKHLKELEAGASDAQARAGELELRLNVERKARKLGIVDEEAAFALMDKTKVVYGDDGRLDAASVETALAGLLQERKWLKGREIPEIPVVSPTNAQKPEARGVLTLKDVEGMTSEQINDRWEEVQQALRSGR